MEKLREWFRLTGVSQGQLADEIGVTRQTMSNWLAGRQHPNAVALRKLNERTRIPLEDLVLKLDAA
jgi:transcriptional regulator with XRE-family HTH domain